MALECTSYKMYSFGRLWHEQQPSCTPFTCQRREHSPSACNGCLTIVIVAFISFATMQMKLKTAAKDLKEQERTRVFYCDHMSPGQKGSLEKRHAELRYILWNLVFLEKSTNFQPA